ncbi:MAG: phosphodiesterase, partial [Chloroflexota bacterium]
MKFKKLIIVGDPHITAEKGPQRGVDSAEVLRKLVSHVNQHHSDAELCLFLGDMTNEGEPEAYTRFRTLIEPLAVPFKLMIGNHDHRQNFQEAFPDNPKDANGFVQFIHDFENQYRLIALDTLNGPPYDELRRHVGMLSEDRLAYLKESLTGAEGRPVIIAMHHQPFRIGLPGMDLIRLLNGDEFIQLVKQYPNVEMLLFGHNHRQITGVAHKIPFACFKSL